MGLRKNGKKRQFIAALCICALLSGIMGTMTLCPVFASQKRTVRVAFFPMDGYHIKLADGTYDGVDVEYLQALCRYANWNIEFVECNSWEAALELLEKKQIDLVGSAQYSEERAKKFRYADLSSGYTFGSIITGADSPLAYEDFRAFQSITFGIVEGYVRTEEFFEYLSDHGVSDPMLQSYESTAQLKAAYEAGKIDAMVHSFTEVEEGHRLIGRFAPKPFYYMTYQGNDDVLRELNQAIADLKMDYPELESELMNRFYHSRLDKTIVLTMEEKLYLSGGRTIPVGYVDRHYPFCYEEEGKLSGLTGRLLEEVEQEVGLHLEYVRYSTYKEAEAALQNGEITLLAFCAETKEELTRKRLVTVKEYAEIPLVLVMNKSTSLSDVSKLATVEYFSTASLEQTVHENAEFIYYDTQGDCLEAVKRGSAQAALCSGYLSEYLLKSDLKFNTLEIGTVLNKQYNISVIARDDIDSNLYGIVSKTMRKFDAKEINEYILKKNVYPLVSITLYIRSHSIGIMIFLIVLLAAVVTVGYFLIRDTMKIQKLMYKDLTMDVWNTNYLLYQGARRLLADKKGQYALVYLGISQLRSYNIIYGWNAGEQLLQRLAQEFPKYLSGKKEIFARGHEGRFVLLLSMENEGVLLGRLEGLKEILEKRIHEATNNKMPMEVGVYLLPKGRQDLRQALDYAGQALESVNNGKEGGIRFYDEALVQEIKERHEREKLLESIEINQNFVAYYQPKVDIRTGEIVGAEALVRFLDPTAEKTVRAPGFFVPYFERIGRITEIDFHVLELACQMLQKRMTEGKKVVPISCNFSRTNFTKEGFAEKLEEVLDRYRIPKELIEVEITETLVVEELQYQMIKQTLEILRKKQIRLSIDDFGAGYSSLGVFEQIPASVIKLDRAFFLNQEDRVRQVKIMRGIVTLAGELNAQVVCEGVETEQDVQLMREIGAHVAQGYYYSRPIPEEEFEKRFS